MINLEKNESNATVIDIEKKELTPLPQKLLEACKSRCKSKDDDGKVDAEAVDYCHCHWRYHYIHNTPMYTMYSRPSPRKKLVQQADKTKT